MYCVCICQLILTQPCIISQVEQTYDQSDPNAENVEGSLKIEVLLQNKSQTKKDRSSSSGLKEPFHQIENS